MRNYFRAPLKHDLFPSSDTNKLVGSSFALSGLQARQLEYFISMKIALCNFQCMNQGGLRILLVIIVECSNEQLAMNSVLNTACVVIYVVINNSIYNSIVCS